MSNPFILMQKEYNLYFNKINIHKNGKGSQRIFA